MNDWQRLDELLERGLDFYGRQLVTEAIQCWREVLYLSPGHQLAIEYLEAAGAKSEQDDGAPTPQASRPTSAAGLSLPADFDESAAMAPPGDEQPLTLESLSALTVELIRERRLEEALTLLYTARAEAPKDQSISRSINVIKQRLTREYRAEIGDLAQVPSRIVDDAIVDELGLTDDEHEVLRLIDGIVALEDIVQSAGLGALQIYRVLAQLLRRGVVKLTAAELAADRKELREAEREAASAKVAPFRPKLVPSTPPPPSPPTPAPPPGPRLVSLPPLPPVPSPMATKTTTLPKPSAPPAPTPSVAPLRPSPYAAHVAEAVRAHLQGKRARAKELLALCVQECPDDPAARRNLERLRERLGFDKEGQ